MSILQFMVDAGLSGIGLLAFFVFREHAKIRVLENRVEELEKKIKK